MKKYKKAEFTISMFLKIAVIIFLLWLGVRWLYQFIFIIKYRINVNNF